MEDVINEVLKKENIPYGKIIKATSGFTNLVYFIDDKLVIKMSKDENTKKKIDKEISIYKNVMLDFMPKYITSGKMQDYTYLIISKVKGDSLYSIWHKLSDNERQNCVKQIANILKVFNSQNTEFLDEEYKDYDWVECLSNELKSKIESLALMGCDISFLKDYIVEQLPLILAENDYGLVYNDAHFDNFIYNNGTLKLIDFDRVRVCPIDFEMLIFKTMCDIPSKFASEADEDNINNEDYKDIFEWFKNEYPEMFKNQYIDQRISLYQFNYLIGQAIKCNDKEWINNLLNKFKI